MLIVIIYNMEIIDIGISDINDTFKYKIRWWW
jgi:hypothetical protein